MTAPFTAPSIVVGVDGSRAASLAAVWAIDEALGRDLPLHLVSVSETADTGRARQALSDAVRAVSDDGRGVAVQSTVVTGHPTPALLDASAAAVMICVGHRGQDNAGSTVRALVASAHCPVAVVRGTDGSDGWVVAELDGTPDSAAVLQYAVEEARLRRVPLRVLGTWQSDGRPADDVDLGSAERMIHAQLDRRLEQWKHRYPDLDVTPVAVHGSGLGYLTANAASIGLVVIGARNANGVAEVLGLRHAHGAVVVIDPQRLL